MLVKRHYLQKNITAYEEKLLDDAYLHGGRYDVWY